jgi:hypothetical protein
VTFADHPGEREITEEPSIVTSPTVPSPHADKPALPSQSPTFRTVYSTVLSVVFSPALASPPFGSTVVEKPVSHSCARRLQGKIATSVRKAIEKDRRRASTAGSTEEVGPS